MSAKKQGSRRPSRKNVVITPHKGGRTERFEARLTPAEKQAIMKVIQESGLSSADWIVQISGTANKNHVKLYLWADGESGGTELTSVVILSNEQAAAMSKALRHPDPLVLVDGNQPLPANLPHKNYYADVDGVHSA